MKLCKIVFHQNLLFLLEPDMLTEHNDLCTWGDSRLVYTFFLFFDFLCIGIGSFFFFFSQLLNAITLVHFIIRFKT